MDAFLDESSRLTPMGHCYVVAAAVTMDDQELVREAMLKLRLKGSALLHWHNESAPRRREIVNRLNDLDIQAIVAGCHPVAPKAQERARSRLLTTVASDLEGEGVENMVIEAREHKQNQKDRQTMAFAQRSGVACNIRYGHVKKSEEPLLWLADVVAGATSLHLAGEDSSYFTELDPSLLIVRKLEP